MTKILLNGYFIVYIIFAIIPAVQAQSKSNAGILPYCEYKGDLWVLLSYSEEYPYWSDFIGEHKPEDKNKLKSTAFREFMEETRGIFKSSYVKDKLSNEKSLKVSKPNTFRFIIKVPYFEVGKIEAIKPGKDTEKVKYCWVKIKDLLKVIDNTIERDKKSISLSACTTKNLDTRIYEDLNHNSPTRLYLDKLIK